MAAGSPPLVPAARSPRVGLLYDERMCAHAAADGEDYPENPERLRAIWRKLDAEGITSRCVLLKAREAEDKYIASVHSQDHIKLIKEISSKNDSSRNKIAKKFNSIYFNQGSSESAVLAAGSVIKVAEKVAAGELSSAIALVRPPGHHAERDKAMGFCLFNNVAVAANYLLNERPDLSIKKILIVDWDVHHGNATQKMFYDDPRVLVFSVHRFDFGDFYPSEEDASYYFIGEEAGRGYNINVPWEQGKCGDADYIAAWDQILLPVTEAFGPDIILVAAGFDAALGDPLGGCCLTPDGYALLLTKLLGFAQGRIVMGLEGGYNLRSTANSVLACAKVLLGDKFTFNTLEKQPHESAWRVIQAVSNELKTCWPVLTGKLSENVSPTPSEVHFLGPEEIQAVSKRGHETSAPARATDKVAGPCVGSQVHYVMEGYNKSKRRRLGGDEGEVDRLDEDMGVGSNVNNDCTSNQEDQEETERKDEQGGSGDQVPCPPRPALATAQSKVAEGHPNSLRATSGRDSACQERTNFPRADSGQDSQGLSFDGLTLEHFELPLEARDAFTTAASQLQSTSPEHLVAQLEDAAWKQLLHVKALRHSHRQALAAAREEVRLEMAELCRAKEAAELRVSELEAKLKQEEDCREHAEEAARIANDARVSAEASGRKLGEIVDLREGELRGLRSAQAAARLEREGWAKTTTEALQALLKMKALGDLGFDDTIAAKPRPVESLGTTLRWLRVAALATPKVAEKYGSICAKTAMNLALILLHSGGCTHLRSLARPDMSFLTNERYTAEVREASKGFYRNVWKCFGKENASDWIAAISRSKRKSKAHARNEAPSK